MKEFFIEVTKEYCPDLNLLDIPTNPDDFLWYAERVNGRIAMLTIISVLMAEFATKKSIFEIIGIFNLTRFYIDSEIRGADFKYRVIEDVETVDADDFEATLKAENLPYIRTDI
jgi:hypothetical protein